MKHAKQKLRTRKAQLTQSERTTVVQAQ